MMAAVTLRWREPDSNRRYRGRRPAAASCRFPLCLISRQRKIRRERFDGGSCHWVVTRGTDGSNPASFSVESANYRSRCGEKARRHSHACVITRTSSSNRIDHLGPGAAAAVIGRAGECVAALCRNLHRGVRRQPLHVREQFPVDKGACSYPVLFNTPRRLVSGASESERSDLFAAPSSCLMETEITGILKR
jgi:hypothetical protein